MQTKGVQMTLRSALALQQENGQLRRENLHLRTQLAKTTVQLAETIEELRILAVPFFRRFRMRRLLESRKRLAVQTTKQQIESQTAMKAEKPRIIVPA